jgi:hypothetical protein
MIEIEEGVPKIWEWFGMGVGIYADDRKGTGGGDEIVWAFRDDVAGILT